MKKEISESFTFTKKELTVFLQKLKIIKKDQYISFISTHIGDDNMHINVKKEPNKLKRWLKQ